MSRLAVLSREIWGEEGPIEGALLIEEGIIGGILPQGREGSAVGVEVADYRGYRVIPGLIDCHCHGYGGFRATSEDPEEVRAFSAALAGVGVTGVLCTAGLIPEGLAGTSAALDGPVPGAALLGIHLEGPFLALPGAGERSAFLRPDLARLEAYWQECRGHLRYLTLAPELPGALDLVDWLVARGVVVGAGHTEAGAAEFRAGLARGVRVSVHTGNAMRGIHHRDVGALGAALLSDTCYAEIIADLDHLCPDMLALLFRLKPPSSCLLVSDSVHLAGLPPGSYPFQGGTAAVGTDGGVRRPDGRLAGSGHPAIKGLANLASVLGFGMKDLIEMSSRNPACLLGLGGRKGGLGAGKDGDFTVVDGDFQVVATYVGGRRVFGEAP